MKQFNFTNVLIVIILALLVYLALKPDSDKKYLDMIEKENQKISKQLEESHILIAQQIREIKLIEKKETIIRNYYNEIIKASDTITTDASAIASIRRWLDSLGTARFD